MQATAPTTSRARAARTLGGLLLLPASPSLCTGFFEISSRFLWWLHAGLARLRRVLDADRYGGFARPRPEWRRHGADLERPASFERDDPCRLTTEGSRIFARHRVAANLGRATGTA